MDKKEIRKHFRLQVLQRDNYCCRMCGKAGKDRQGGEGWKKFHRTEPATMLDAHHITDRHNMPNGGYVTENGIAVCDECHAEAEKFHQNIECKANFLPEALYKLIGYTYNQAVAAAAKIRM
jgi:hypothetical protein